MTKSSFFECVACVCLTVGTILSVSSNFMAIGFLMGVVSISFSLPLDLCISLGNSEIG